MKQITSLFQSIGKRKRLLGFEASFDGQYIGTYATRPEAEHILNQIAYELARAS